MNITINAVHFTPTQNLTSFVEGKVKKLENMSDEIIGAEVYLKLEKTQNLENKIAEIRLDLPGNDAFAKKRAKSFEESTDNAIDALKKQITKKKEKKVRV